MKPELPDPTVTRTDTGADVTYRGVTPEDGPTFDVTATVTWTDGAPAITSLTIPQGMTAARVVSLPWVDLRQTSFSTASDVYIDPDEFRDAATGLSIAEFTEAVQTLRPSTDQFSAAIGAVCRWATYTGQTRLEALWATTGKSTRVVQGYLSRAADRFTETGDPRFDLDGRAV